MFAIFKAQANFYSIKEISVIHLKFPQCNMSFATSNYKCLMNFFPLLTKADCLDRGQAQQHSELGVTFPNINHNNFVCFMLPL